jgi:hypothetical protein
MAVKLVVPALRRQRRKIVSSRSALAYQEFDSKKIYVGSK